MICRQSLMLAVLLSVALAAAGRAQSAAGSDPFANIPPAMQKYVDQTEVSGVVTLVATKDKVLHLAAVGKSSVDTGRKMETNDLFWIASMSKPITATAAAMLVDDGKLKWDDPVEKYIPEFKDKMVDARGGRGGRGRRGGGATTATQAQAAPIPASRPITLRDLVTHTSGLGEYPRGETNPHMTLEQMAQLIAKQPLRFQPGTRWAYSTAGLDTVGRIVEVASGMPFDKFLQTRLFDPLGMKDTTFWPKPEDMKRLAVSYRRDAQTGDLTPETISYMYDGAIDDPKRPPLGGAGLFSTAEDLAKFYQMMLSGGSYGGKKYVKPETVAEMTKNQIGDLTARAGMPWGYGFCAITDPSQMEANHAFNPGSWGHGGAFGTGSWVDPKRGEIFIIMLQRNGWGNPDNTPAHQDFNTLAAADFDKMER